MEFDHFFRGDDSENPIYKVQIFNNLRYSELGLFYNSRPKCEFCGNDHKDNCDFEFDDPKVVISDVLRTIKLTQRPSLVLSVLWRSND